MDTFYLLEIAIAPGEWQRITVKFYDRGEAEDNGRRVGKPYRVVEVTES